MNVATPVSEISAEDRLRADLYNYLAVMLVGPPDQTLLDQTAALAGDETPLGQAIQGLARVAGRPRFCPPRLAVIRSLAILKETLRNIP